MDKDQMAPGYTLLVEEAFKTFQLRTKQTIFIVIGALSYYGMEGMRPL